jgi:integrase
MPVTATETAIARLTAEARQTGTRRELIDAKEAGLRLRISPGGKRSRDGARTWVLACRDQAGRMRRFTIGSFPEVGIADARKKAQALRVQVRQHGADPVEDRRRKLAIGRDAKAGIGTLSALLSLYAAKEGATRKSWTDCQSRISSVFAKQLDRAIASLTPSELQITADAWPSQQSAAAAVRYIRPVLKWAERRNYAPVGLSAIVPPATVGRRDRYLSKVELTSILPVLRSSATPYAPAMRLMLLTLVRREEACQARWRDVDFTAGTWRIADTKNKQPHVVPLSRQAMELLQSIRPADAKPDALVFATSTGKPLGNWDRASKAIHQLTKTEGWTRHDLRRTGATMLGEMGETPDIIEAALNHVAIRSPLAATYNRSRYRPQVAAALQRLADALDGIEAGDAEVVPLRA